MTIILDAIHNVISRGDILSLIALDFCLGQRIGMLGTRAISSDSVWLLFLLVNLRWSLRSISHVFTILLSNITSLFLTLGIVDVKAVRYL